MIAVLLLLAIGGGYWWGYRDARLQSREDRAFKRLRKIGRPDAR